MKILIEQQAISPVLVLLKLLRIAKDWTAAVNISTEQSDEAICKLTGHLSQVDRAHFIAWIVPFREFD